MKNYEFDLKPFVTKLLAKALARHGVEDPTNAYALGQVWIYLDVQTMIEEAYA